MTASPVQPRSLWVCLVIAASCLTMFSGCSSSDSAAIAAFESINAQAVSEGGDKAVRMQRDGDKVNTIYILSHVDDVMPHVGKLKNVVEVYFQADGFADDHVQYVNRLSSLNSLIASKTKVTDAGVEQMAGMKLQGLALDGTVITSAALKSIAKMPELLSLDLGGTSIADDLTGLASLEKLEWLVIRDMDLSNLDDASVKTLAELPNLKRLTVTNTGITDETIQIIKRAKPAINLEAEQGEDPTAAAAAQAAATKGDEGAEE